MERNPAPDRAYRRSEGVSLGAEAGVSGALVLVCTHSAVCALALWTSHHGGRWGLIQGLPALPVAVSL